MSQKNYKYLNNEPEYAPQSKITAHMILIYGPCLGCSTVSGTNLRHRDCNTLWVILQRMPQVHLPLKTGKRTLVKVGVRDKVPDGL